MNLRNNWILVEELIKDFNHDGLLHKYDDSDPIMHVRVITAEEDIISEIIKDCGTLEDAVLIVSRGNKTPYLGKFLIKYDSIIGNMTKAEFDRL